MSDVNVAPGGELAPVAQPAPTPADDKPISVREAARILGSARRKPEQQAQAPAAPVEAAQAEPAQELAPEANAAPEQAQAPGETQEIDPAPEPTIDPPRSWTKEAKERWAELPRETQDYLAKREQERDREVRTRQNEAAEQRKAVEAERQKVEQQRQQYEQALPALMQMLQAQQAGEFSDIKTMEDVEKMAREDWPRYALWDAHQKKVSAIQAEMRATQDRQSQEWQSKWADFSKREDAKFIEKVPEFADKDQAAKLQSAAVEVLQDIGFSDDELAQLWNGQASVSLRDHRVQLLIRDGIKLREAQAKAKVAQTKPVPPVQRPGVAQPKGAQAQAQVQALDTRLNKSGSLRDAVNLLRAERAARR